MISHFDQVKPSKGGTHFEARCLLCGDSKKNPYKKRFHLDWNNGVPGWHCWNCGEHGNFIELYGIVKGISYEDAKKELFKWDEEKIKRWCKNKSEFKKAKEKHEVEENNFNEIRCKCYSLQDEESRYTRALKKFYDDRKIPYDYKIYICYDGRYRNRIIIPVFNEKHDIIYFQARRIPGTSIEPKYDNPVSPKELVILNRHKFDRNKSIIVHEGLIDAFMINDHQGTSCLGKEISEELVKELLNLTDKYVIVALDNDSEAYKALERIMRKNKYANKLKYFLYPSEFEQYDDINSIVRNSKEINAYEMITQNSVSYSTAFTKLSIQKLFKTGGNGNENYKDRK